MPQVSQTDTLERISLIDMQTKEIRDALKSLELEFCRSFIFQTRKMYGKGPTIKVSNKKYLHNEECSKLYIEKHKSHFHLFWLFNFRQNLLSCKFRRKSKFLYSCSTKVYFTKTFSFVYFVPSKQDLTVVQLLKEIQCSL